VPGFRYFSFTQPIVIPSFALRTVKATVLNRFRLRQTDLVPAATIRKRAASLNFDQQRLAREMKIHLPFRIHQLKGSKWPFPADELQMQSGNTVGRDTMTTNDSN